MLTDKQKDTVIAAICDFINDGVSFTAFDVTRRVRAAGTKVRHTGTDNVRDFVHSLWIEQDPVFPDSYERSLINKSFGTCFCFHLTTEDPDEYDPDSLKPTQSQGTAVGALAPLMSPSPVADMGDGVIHTDKRGRLWVPVASVRSIGLSPGDMAAVYPSGTHLHVVDARDPMSLKDIVSIKFYVVNKNGEIEVPRTTLQQVFAVDGLRVEHTPDIDGNGKDGLVVTVA